ncbi:hypothetical protein TREMEDRAFT_11764, partial [Tremella mesenterica DSM 1558]|uniref:uncharacterized protein n=1 Tax=Tremella mesenterica (strain ATCC 24925 / CBS 8224 / DSM 1558 / NBRC 9311 / NRRL Y-6157 / RJB 2259-6 / UBC 559-6) TaxID=578456 RepID=UPI0003F48E55
SHQHHVLKKKTSSSTGRDDKMLIGQWRIGRTIGKGSSGRVKIAKHAITGKYAAIKIVPKGMIIESRMSVSEAGVKQDKVLLGIEREIVIMKLIDHPNVLNLYDVWETSTELYLIMEYVPGGELFDYLVKRGRLPVSEALHYFQQIIMAVDYCHRFNICHRDLKPENLLLDKDKNIKVADFGMAAWEAGERMLETSCGSPHYASPEIVAGKAYHGSSSDIWSCGIILFALLTGRLPFDDDNIRSLLQKVKVGVFEMPDEIKDPARDLLSRMLEKDPEQRITMPDILAHPFFVSRSPRPIPGRALVSPPSLTEVERPVNSPEEIDPDIMGNLKTLWSGATDDEIVAALMSREKTWEKAIYHLLIKYRNKHLENYNMDDEEDVEARAKRQTRRQAGPSPAKRKGGPPPTAQKPRLAPLGENDTIQERVATARPQAPTPKKASGVTTDSPAVPKKGTMGPPPLRSPAGPRPPMSRGNTYTPGPPLAPAIMLQEATPVKEMVPPPLPSPSPRPRSEILPSPLIPDAAQLSPLNVPRVGDQQLQHFFNEVANQLNTMNIRSSVGSGSSSSSAILGADYQTYLAYANGAIIPPTSPVLSSSTMDPNQFADADDDETVAPSVHSVVSPSLHTSPAATLVGLGIGGPPSHNTRPGLHPMQDPNNRWSYTSSNSSRGTPATSYIEPSYTGTATYTPAPMIWTESPFTSPPQRPAPLPNHVVTRLAPTRPPPPAPRPLTMMSRDESYVVLDSAESTPSDPSVASWGTKSSGFSAHRGQDGFGMLKRKKKPSPIELGVGFTATPVSSPMPSLGVPSPTGLGPSPKRSWFNNLFSFKPPSCTLLSHDNIGGSREKAKKVLGDMGVQVNVVEIDGLRALRCRFEDVKGNGTSARGVRFRIEFSRSSQNTSGGYNTLVSLTLEKGAQSSFKSPIVDTRQLHSLTPPSSSTADLTPPVFRTARSASTSSVISAHSSQ